MAATTTSITTTTTTTTSSSTLLREPTLCSPARAAPATEQRLRRLSASYDRSSELGSNGYQQHRRSISRSSNGADSERDAHAATRTRRASQRAVNESESADLTAYYAFSRRRSSSVSVIRDEAGLSGFLEYKKLDGSWRPFLFQTVDFQLLVYRVHPTHQVNVMSADLRKATEIALVHESSVSPTDTRVFKLGINGTVITLRAVSHHAALYWIEGLQQLKTGRSLEIVSDRPTLESEDDIFRQIDQLTYMREWVPAPSSTSLCWFCLPPLPLWRTRAKDVSYPEDHREICCATC